MEKHDDKENNDVAKVRVLKEKIEFVGIKCDFTSPGKYIHLICPKVCFFIFLYAFLIFAAIMCLLNCFIYNCNLILF